MMWRPVNLLAMVALLFALFSAMALADLESDCLTHAAVNNVTNVTTHRGICYFLYERERWQPGWSLERRNSDNMTHGNAEASCHAKVIPNLGIGELFRGDNFTTNYDVLAKFGNFDWDWSLWASARQEFATSNHTAYWHFYDGITRPKEYIADPLTLPWYEGQPYFTSAAVDRRAVAVWTLSPSEIGYVYDEWYTYHQFYMCEWDFCNWDRQPTGAPYTLQPCNGTECFKTEFTAKQGKQGIPLMIKYSGMNELQCAEECSKLANCFGFTHIKGANECGLHPVDPAYCGLLDNRDAIMATKL